MLGIYETLPPEVRDDKINLVYELNKESYFAVNTTVGQTDRIMLPEIVLQGGKWGLITHNTFLSYLIQKRESIYTTTREM